MIRLCLTSMRFLIFHVRTLDRYCSLVLEKYQVSSGLLTKLMSLSQQEPLVVDVRLPEPGTVSLGAEPQASRPPILTPLTQAEILSIETEERRREAVKARLVEGLSNDDFNALHRSFEKVRILSL